MEFNLNKVTLNTIYGLNLMGKRRKVGASNKFHKPDTFNIMIYFYSPSLFILKAETGQNGMKMKP